MQIAFSNAQMKAFTDKIWMEPNCGCWLWSAAVNKGGYGIFRANGKSSVAHRITYEMHIGKIPEGLVLDHQCRVRCCVNPAHLEPVTNRVNCRRGDCGKHHKERTCCPKGHPYSDQNVQLRHWSGGVKRRCAECHRISSLAYQRRRRGIPESAWRNECPI